MTGGGQVPELVFSKHALERLKEMGVTEAECVSVRTYPVEDYWAPRHQSQTYRGSRVAIATKPIEDDRELVTTVLWAGGQEVYDALGDGTRERWPENRRRFID